LREAQLEITGPTQTCRKGHVYPTRDEACLECKKAWRVANADRIREEKRSYYEANKEKIKAKRLAYCEVNKDAIAQNKAAYYEVNRELVASQKRRYYEANKEKIKAYRRDYYAANKGKIKEYHKKYHAANGVRIREQKRERHAANRPTRHERVLHAYGLTVEDYARMLNAQDLKCAVCRDVLVFPKFSHVDHCHATGVVRGILCHHCNVALGHARDSANRLRALASYLERHGTPPDGHFGGD
jgi:hypothetical protein